MFIETIERTTAPTEAQHRWVVFPWKPLFAIWFSVPRPMNVDREGLQVCRDIVVFRLINVMNLETIHDHPGSRRRKSVLVSVTTTVC
jgi:hypothetical protein